MMQTLDALTREAIREMPAGPEMDRLVAERVMGWTAERVTGPHDGREFENYVDAGGAGRVAPDKWCPSTDIVAAWQVFNRWSGEYRFICWRSGAWEVHLTRLIAGQSVGDFKSSAEAESEQLAICRAALLATVRPK